MQREEFIDCCGLNIRKVNLVDLLLSPPMLVAYILLAIGLIGWIEIYHLRFFHHFVNNGDVIKVAGGDPEALKEAGYALKEQIFGLKEVEEVNKAEPWGIFVSQYTYLLYGGSALIFMVALAELFHLKVAPKVAAALMTFGIAMALGGMTSIASDWGNPLNIFWMILNPQPQSGMWLMLPLYSIYIPFTFIEIYFLITNKREMARKFAGVLVILGIIIDIIEFFIQGILFNLNTPRHLWTDIPLLFVYFLLTGALTAVGGAILFSFLALKNKPYFADTISILRKAGLALIVLVGIYEVINLNVVDPKWVSLITGNSPVASMYWTYIIIGLVVPFIFLLFRSRLLNLLGALGIIVGTFFMRQAFIYGGNIVPMTERVPGMGPQANGIYNLAEVKPFAYVPPHAMEVLIIIGCVGVGILIYTILDKLFAVRDVNDHADH
jgi:Ni/Fe-hydrogenase subunit HybB-like protein